MLQNPRSINLHCTVKIFSHYFVTKSGLYTIQDIATVLHANATLSNGNATIEHLLTDSRRIAFPQTSLFFSLSSPQRDGHQFIPELYAQGVRSFVVKYIPKKTTFTDANFLVVDDTLQALQTVAAWHRQKFTYPVVGITGSNGKTIVKEWLYQLLVPDYNIIRSPRSYNSQIGVPLSVWQMTADNNLGIFEAGISKRGEMEALRNIIQPTIGIFTKFRGSAQRKFRRLA